MHTQDAFLALRSFSEGGEKWQTRVKSEKSWTASAEEVMAKNYDLSAKNPNGKGDTEHESPEQLLKSIEIKEDKIKKIISEIKEQL